MIELKTLPDHSDWTVAASEMGELAAAVIDRLGVGSRVVLELFDWRGPRHLRRTRPDLRLAWLTRAETVAKARLWWDGPTPADFGNSVPRAVAAEAGSRSDDGRFPAGRPIWAPEHVDLTPELITEAHALGLDVLPWTVNRTADMTRLIDWGIDGLITDRPDIAREAMAQAGLPVPVRTAGGQSCI